MNTSRPNWMCLAAVWCFSTAPSLGQQEPRSGLIEAGRFVHIPGPSPALVHGEPGAWDDGVIEAADAFRDGDTYYLFYHGTGQGKGYRLGVAIASHPVGPFRKHGHAPVLDLGPPGSWDDRGVACAMILREGDGTYRMFYSGLSTAARSRWSIGLATARHPLGPWEKYAKNPVLEDFGYVGGVVRASGKYHLYAEHPIGATGPDYGPISLATAGAPTGPWTRWEENPVIPAGAKGEWNDGGFSEGEVLEYGGVFHFFGGGAKIHPERIRSQESIGYAFSTDGYRFSRLPREPVAPREAVPNAAALSEVHAIIEPPFVYLYHTLRYKQPRRPQDEPKFPVIEDLGIQVIATQRPFEIAMPVVHRDTIGPGEITALVDCPPLCLSSANEAELVAECTCGPRATKGLRVHVRTSEDGLTWPASDAAWFDADGRSGATVRATRVLSPKPRFAKVLIENLDPSESVSRVAVVANLRG
ncbi:MAG: hypothetical protein HUU20_10490 [Pirellulales bacterium]|nr:hypothetical protein [Pirellulales bacterium]